MRIFLLVILMSALCSCKQEKLAKLDLQETLQLRMDAYLVERDQLCKKEAITLADQYIDSLIDGWIDRALIDSISFPSKPIRPQRPEPILGR